MRLDDKLREEYQILFAKCVVKEELKVQINKKILSFKDHYKDYADIGLATGVPWWFIALLHMMESNNDFTKHLHNGDSLKARTVQIPPGRPVEGNPPFTFEESAIDALEYEKLDQWEEWTIPGILFQIESYNGFGYRRWHPEVKSPYLWSGTNHYTKGKYVADGKFYPDAVSKQVGVACFLKAMEEQGIL